MTAQRFRKDFIPGFWRTLVCPVMLLCSVVACARAAVATTGPTAAPTSAPAAAPAPIVLTDITVEINRLRRHYIVYAPTDLDPHKAAPVVMMLHGAGGTAAGAATHYGWCELATREHFIAVFPEATRFDLTQPASFADNPPL